MLSQGTEEYLFTAALIISLIGLVVASIGGRKYISEALSKSGVKWVHLLIAFWLVVLFLVVELSLVKPTQQLFFDDDIYQAMAVDMLHTGQAWMCDYGTPFTCYMGEIFHEPVGPSFDVAIGYAVMGISRLSTNVVQLATSCIAIFFTFLAGVLLLRDARAALFAELLMAGVPIMLVWAVPMTSDMPYLAWSLVALFFLLVFSRKKNDWTFAMALFSLAMVLYMKVDSLLLLLVFPLMYLILDDKGIVASWRKNIDRLWENALNTRALVLVLIFVILISPMIIFAYGEQQAGDFGATGTTIQNTCVPNTSTVATQNFDVKNIEYNICSNFYFWFNEYSSDYVMQPVAFTVLAIIGAATMLYDKKRELLAVGGWFIAVFVLYTAFYAGSATYGVDWRFQLSLIAQACLLGGMGCVAVMEIGEHIASRIKKNKEKIGSAIGAIVVLCVVAYSIYMFVPQLSVNPATLQQAGDARFYENFVFNQSSKIPASCLVFTYDPTLFILNNRTATQLSNIYDSAYMNTTAKQYSCLVVDYGYWCYTPNNLCTNVGQSFELTTIANATYPLFNRTYSFYYATPKNENTTG